MFLNLNTAEKSLLRYCLLVRTISLIITVLLRPFPDHNADAFKPPEPVAQNPVDSLVRNILAGYLKWDSVYFAFISHWNYLYEQSLAFFPVWPCLLGAVSRTLHFGLAPVLQLDTVILLAGFGLNLLFGLAISVLLYRLGLIVLASAKVSYFSAILFSLNPALMFFSSLYSESVFFLCTLLALLCYERRHMLLASLLISLSVGCRSNGLLNVGYIGFALLCSDRLSSLVWSERTILDTKRSFTMLLRSTFSWWYSLLLTLIPYVFFVLNSLFPFIAYQAYAFYLFCSDSFLVHGTTIFSLPKPPNSLIDFGIRSKYRFPRWIYSNYSLPQDPLPTWCLSNLPFSYSHIQKTYWNVDLFGYYQLKQIPNFLLACPVILLSLSCASAFYGRAPRTYKTLGLQAETPRDRRLLPYVLHMLFLTIYGVTHINIQVLTRLIFSSCPIIYWYCAYLLYDCPNWRLDFLTETRAGTKDDPPKPYSWFDTLRTDLFRLCSIFNPAAARTRKQQALLLYFISYALVGTVLHSKFLPWT